MFIDNKLATEIYRRTNRIDFKYLEVLKDNTLTIEDLIQKTGNSRNTVMKIIDGLYKCCLVNSIQKSDENNKKFYNLTDFGLTLLKFRQKNSISS